MTLNEWEKDAQFVEQVRVSNRSNQNKFGSTITAKTPIHAGIWNQEKTGGKVNLILRQKKLEYNVFFSEKFCKSSLFSLESMRHPN